MGMVRTLYVWTKDIKSCTTSVDANGTQTNNETGGCHCNHQLYWNTIHVTPISHCQLCILVKFPDITSIETILLYHRHI